MSEERIIRMNQNEFEILQILFDEAYVAGEYHKYGGPVPGNYPQADLLSIYRKVSEKHFSRSTQINDKESNKQCK